MPATKRRLVLVPLLILLAYSTCPTTADHEALADIVEELSIASEEVASSEEASSSTVPDADQEIVYVTPDLDAESLPYFLYEHFDDELAFNSKWTQSKATKAESEEFVYDGEWSLTPSHSRLKGKF